MGEDRVDGDRQDRVELGVALLASLEDPELSVAEAVTRLESVTEAPALTRQILDEAVRRGVVDRADGVLTVRSSQYVSHQSQVVTREGDYECRRCSASLSTGHFIQYDAGELGPFGSTCIRKVTGRDD
ncbi:MAG: DUF5830 family protein [Halobacteriaceae archaeon]